MLTIIIDDELMIEFNKINCVYKKPRCEEYYINYDNGDEQQISADVFFKIQKIVREFHTHRLKRKHYDRD